MREEIIVEFVRNGLKAGPYIVRAKKVSKGRFAEEVNIDLTVSLGSYEEELLHLKVFTGRPPYYRPWIEVFGIRPVIRLGEATLRYFGSVVEDEVLKMLAKALEDGERLFVEYYTDEETMKALDIGVPPPATRLGLKLLALGFTWFKNWYYPEGFMEGGPKLQAEKPLSEEHKERQLRNLMKELLDFISSSRTSGNEYLLRSVKRAEEAVRIIKRMLSASP